MSETEKIREAIRTLHDKANDASANYKLFTDIGAKSEQLGMLSAYIDAITILSNLLTDYE